MKECNNTKSVKVSVCLKECYTFPAGGTASTVLSVCHDTSVFLMRPLAFVSTAATLLHRALKLPNSEAGKPVKLSSLAPRYNLMATHKKSLLRNWLGCSSVGLTHWIVRASRSFPTSKVLPSLLLEFSKVKTLQQEFPQVDDQCSVVYKIPCASCRWSYIGETKRYFSTRRKEHIRNTKQCAKGSETCVNLILITPSATLPMLR